MPTSATPSCTPQISASVSLGLGARLLVRRRQIRPRVAVAGGALRRRRFGAANPRVEPASRSPATTSARDPASAPSSRRNASSPSRGRIGLGMPDALRLGRVVPCVPVDAEPAVAAGDGQRVENGIRGRIRSQAETAEDARDRGVENPARRLAPAHRLDDEEQSAQLRRKLRIDDVRARVRGGGERARVDTSRAVDDACRCGRSARLPHRPLPTPAPGRSCPRPGRRRRRARSASEPACAAARAARSTSQNPRSVPATRPDREARSG